MKQKFNIKKKGDNFVAFDLVDKKRSYGRINIKTGKFVGDTRCMIALHKHLDGIKDKEEDTKQVLVDKVIEQIKEDVRLGDLTAVDELLKFVPEQNLKAYLPEIWG
jgi:hypothetical protein